ncbi:hypothetical protein [Mesorhizobium sp. 1B3]|uniref:hypothetical protein n=1 Tax=Mesorhizobium sp. 1B3 TaxID=3243599 RepID=UPI003D956AD5
MQETGKHDGQQEGIVFLYRLLLWLVVAFSLSETPFGRGEFFADPESRSAKLSREFRSAPCRHHVVATHISTDTQLAASSRATQKAHATENTESASAIASGPAALEGQCGEATSLSADRGLRQTPTIGFSSRAPPSLV